MGDNCNIKACWNENTDLRWSEKEAIYKDWQHLKRGKCGCLTFRWFHRFLKIFQLHFHIFVFDLLVQLLKLIWKMECYATHFWGWGKIFLCSILFLPILTICSVCLSIFFFIACLPARAKRGMAISAIKKKIDRYVHAKFLNVEHRKFLSESI